MVKIKTTWINTTTFLKLQETKITSEIYWGQPEWQLHTFQSMHDVLSRLYVEKLWRGFSGHAPGISLYRREHKSHNNIAEFSCNDITDM